MKLPPFDYECPTTLADAVCLLASHKGKARALAGGQSLIPMMAFRAARPSLLVDLRKLPLHDIAVDPASIRLGAMVRWRDILDDCRLKRAHPLLVVAVEHVGHYQIRNRGTVGGSLGHADPASELPGVAVTCDAEISVFGKGGPRTVQAADFFLAPFTSSLAPDEIIIDVRLPAWPSERRWGFQEFGRRHQDFALAAALVFYDEDRDGRVTNAHIGVIGVGDRPMRLIDAEAAVNNRKISDATIAFAAEATSDSIHPPENIHASAAYRRALAGTMVERALRAAMARETPA